MEVTHRSSFGSESCLIRLDQKIRVTAGAVGNRAALDLRKHAAQNRIVITNDCNSIKGYAIDKLKEGSFYVAHVAVAIHVFAVNIGNYREDRREPQERPVALIGFGDQILRLTRSRIRA